MCCKRDPPVQNQAVGEMGRHMSVQLHLCERRVLALTCEAPFTQMELCTQRPSCASGASRASTLHLRAKLHSHEWRMHTPATLPPLPVPGRGAGKVGDHCCKASSSTVEIIKLSQYCPNPWCASDIYCSLKPIWKVSKGRLCIVSCYYPVCS